MTLLGLSRCIVSKLHIILIIVAQATSTDVSDVPDTTPERELSSHFNLRLYWKRGYRWQERSSERWWCLQCRSSSCSKGSSVKIEKCNRKWASQHFYFDDGRIRSRRNRAVCLERDGRSIHLQTCDNSRHQIWSELRKGSAFQLRIPGNSQKCASQHHHVSQICLCKVST